MARIAWLAGARRRSRHGWRGTATIAAEQCVVCTNTLCVPTNKVILRPVPPTPLERSRDGIRSCSVWLRVTKAVLVDAGKQRFEGHHVHALLRCEAGLLPCIQGLVARHLGYRDRPHSRIGCRSIVNRQNWARRGRPAPPALRSPKPLLSGLLAAGAGPHLSS